MMYSDPMNSQIIAINPSASEINAATLSARAGSEVTMRPGVRCSPGNSARSSTRSPRQSTKVDPSSPRMRLNMMNEWSDRTADPLRRYHLHKDARDRKRGVWERCLRSSLSVNLHRHVAGRQIESELDPLQQDILSRAERHHSTRVAKRYVPCRGGVAVPGGGNAFT